MALSGDELFTAVKAVLPVAKDAALQEAHLKPLCKAIVDYFVENTEVTITAGELLLSAAPGSPVTGTAEGTIS